MILLDIKINNFLCFNNFKANFTYPKKLVNQIIDDEFLKDYPNFRYNKINLIMGSNATGKTSLGRVLVFVNTFIRTSNEDFLNAMILDSSSSSDLSISFLDDKYIFYHLKIHKSRGKSFNYEFFKKKLSKTDTYEVVIKNMVEKKINSILQLSQELKDISLKYMFNFTDINALSFDPIFQYFDEYIDIMNNLIKSFDSSIKSITKSKEIKNCLIINFENQSYPIENGRRIETLHFLSTGTRYAFVLGVFLLGLKHSLFGFYYVDELCSNIDSTIEKEIFSTFVELTKQNEQLFYTTHNPELLSLSLPNHSFCFLKKEGTKIELIKASEKEKRNNVDIKNLFDNNYFGISPTLEYISRL